MKLSVLSLLLALFLSFNSNPSLAGGGGCGDDCLADEPTDNLAICKLVKIRKANKKVIALDPLITQQFDLMKRGFKILLRGGIWKEDPKKKEAIYTAHVKFAEQKRPAYFGRYGKPEKNRIQLEPLAFKTEQHRSERYSNIRNKKPPQIGSQRLVVHQKEGRKYAQVKWIVRGRFDPNDPQSWRETEKLAMIAYAKCKALKLPADF